MSTTAEHLSDPELLETAWDLSPLVDGEGPGGVERELDEALERSDAFAATYAGKVAELDADGLRTAMLELAAINELVGKAGSYASLQLLHRHGRPRPRRTAAARCRSGRPRLETKLLFFELEWAAVEDERAEALLADPSLDFCRHHLRSARRYRPHLLTEPEEKILAEKSLTSQSAWGRLFGELVSALRVGLDGEDGLARDRAQPTARCPTASERRTAAEAVSAALEPGLRTRAFIYNTLIHDKAVDDRLRAYPHWLASRNLANEASDESVMALIEAVRGRY